MQALLDFLPVIAFVATYWTTGDMKTSIAVIMGAVLLQVLATWLIKRELSKMLIVSAVLVVGLGSVSLILDNPIFFKWKPTGLYWLFAIVFLGSQFIGEQPLIKRMMQSMTEGDFELTDANWKKLNLAWVMFFIVAGSANIYVAYQYAEAVWVNFKLFGLFGLTFLFLVMQALWMSRHATIDEHKANENQGKEE